MIELFIIAMILLLWLVARHNRPQMHFRTIAGGKQSGGKIGFHVQAYWNGKELEARYGSGKVWFGLDWAKGDSISLALAYGPDIVTILGPAAPIEDASRILRPMRPDESAQAWLDEVYDTSSIDVTMPVPEPEKSPPFWKGPYRIANEDVFFSQDEQWRMTRRGDYFLSRRDETKPMHRIFVAAIKTFRTYEEMMAYLEDWKPDVSTD